MSYNTLLVVALVTFKLGIAVDKLICDCVPIPKFIVCAVLLYLPPYALSPVAGHVGPVGPCGIVKSIKYSVLDSPS